MTHIMQLAGVPDRELLGMLVGSKTASKLYQGSLRSLFNCEESPHRKLAAARELVKRSLVEEMQCRSVFTAPEAVKAYLRMHFSGREYESFVVMYMDAQNRLITTDELFRGTLTQTSVYPREVVKAALKNNAAGLIFSHNHPSGVAEPSRADELLTQTLKQALALVDVRVLDHVVVAGPSTLSFAERGLL